MKAKTIPVRDRGAFPCECGRAYSTAKAFSDHCHTDCKAGIITVGTAVPKQTVN